VRVPSTNGSPLPGPGTSRHQPQVIDIRITRVPGGLRVSTRQARGWARVARNADQLAHTVAEAYNEVAIASYARWRRQLYDLDKLTPVDDPTEPPRQRTPSRRGSGATTEISYRRGAAARPDTADPRQWVPNPDGPGYISPGGRRYTNPDYIRRIEKKRAALNLPIRAQAS
jgi:hypothetical protein